MRVAVFDRATGTIEMMFEGSERQCAAQETAHRGILEAPPDVSDETHEYSPVSGGFVLRSMPIEQQVDPLERLRWLRHEAMVADADPLFFKWQRGEATREEWEAKVTEIRAAYPYPEES